MISRIVTVSALVLAVVFGALVPRATADWTPITPLPAGCADNGIWAKHTDAGLKIVVPVAADWQIGYFKVDGVRREIVKVRQVSDTDVCKAWSIRVDAPDSGSRVRYAWFGDHGAFLESGRLRVR